MMKLKLLIPLLICFVASFGQAPVNRGEVMRKLADDNTANGYMKLPANAIIPSEFLPPGNGGSSEPSRYYINDPLFQTAYWKQATKKVDGSNITDADIDSVLFVKSAGLYYKRWFEGPAYDIWWGVKVNDGQNDHPRAQAAINACISARISALHFQNGYYDLNNGLVVRQYRSFVYLSLIGYGNAFDPVAGGGTVLKINNPLEAAIYIQKGKGCTVSNVRIEGMNNIVLPLSSIMDPSTPKSSWSFGGSSLSPTAPHAGIVIDPFYGAGVAVKYTGAGKDTMYNEVSNAGSTQIKIQDCYVFKVGVAFCISPAGMQNGENIFLSRIWVEKAYVGVSTGDSQNRTVHVTDYSGWYGIHCHFDSETFSAGGSGCPPGVTNANIAGGSTYLCKNGTWYGNAFVLDGPNTHIELMSRIGGNLNGQLGKIELYNANIDFTGSFIEAGIFIRNPNQMVQCETFTMIGGRLVYYGLPQSLLGFSVKRAYLLGTNMTSPILPGIPGGSVTYKNCKLIEGLDAYVEDLVVSTSSTFAATVSSVSSSTNTWTYTVGSTTGISVGNYVILQPKTGGQLTGEFTAGNTLTVPAGIVTNINGNTITVTGVPYGLANGQNIDVWTRKYTQP